jgi:hypothetical protein
MGYKITIEIVPISHIIFMKPKLAFTSDKFRIAFTRFNTISKLIKRDDFLERP